MIAFKGVGGVKSHLFFFLIFSYVVELSFLISKSAHLFPNSGWFRKNWTKIQCFDHDFEKKTFKSLLLIHPLTVLAENLLKGTSQECKNLIGLVKTLCFYHNFNTKNLKITTPHSLFDRFS